MAINKYLSTSKERAGATDAYSGRDANRRTAIAAKASQALLKKEAISDVRAQAVKNQKRIRYGASQAMAMGAQPGMGAGGGAIAAAGQVGRDAEMAGIAQSGQDADKIRGAEQAAQEAAISSAEYAATQGDSDSDFQEALAEGQTEAEQAIQDSQGFWNDDEAGAKRKIRAMIARVRVKSPGAAKQLEDKYLREDGSGQGRIDSWWD